MSLSISDKPVVRHIVDHCYAHGVKHVVISPGSRNAPMILSFPASQKFKCLTIVDERSAAYFALGLARRDNSPVALVCTSGTAVLNYSPALAEAYYQQIPLIAITADRPPEYIDQADGQTIRQTGVFRNFVRYSCQLPFVELSGEDHRLTDRLLNEAFQNALGNVRGPVHINVPFREPLYGTVESTDSLISRIVPVRQFTSVDNKLVDELLAEMSGYDRVLFLSGALNPDNRLKLLTRSLAEKGVVVMTETLSNLSGNGIFGNTDRLLEYFAENTESIQPDLLITLDVPVLSKRLKQWIRKYPPKAHWHFSNQEIIVDTYQCLTRQIKGDAVQIMTEVEKQLPRFSSGYVELWEEARNAAKIRHETFLDEVSWSDFMVFNQISKAMPDRMEVHLANSTPVRYAQLFEWNKHQTFYANRGTSGIDGCVSTAAGAAFAGSRPVTLIVGDLAFLYDSNGLWHKYLSDSFRVIVVNNGGGGIFRYIPGPSETDQLEPFFEARGNHQCRGIAETFGLQYYAAGNSLELEQILDHFWEVQGSPALLEIFTPGDTNGEILRDYFRYLRES